MTTAKFGTSVRLLTMLFVLLGGISACGVPGPGGGSSDSPPADSEDVPATEVPVSVEATDRMQGIASWQKDLFKLITPQQAYALEGLTEINNLDPLSISVVSLGFTFQENGETNVPDFNVVKEDTGGYMIQFDQLFFGQIDLVAKVRFGNGEFLYAPLHNIANNTVTSIVINIGSHYVLKKLFDQISTREQLTNLRDCTATDCSDQAVIKSDLLKNLSAVVQEYDLEVPSNLTIDEALDFLDSNLDLRNLVETGVSEILRDKNPIHQGTERDVTGISESLLGCIAQAVDYNTTFFGLSLNNLAPNDAINESSFGVLMSQTDPDNDLLSLLLRTTDVNEIRREAMTFKNSILRETLLQSEAGEFSVDSSEPVRGFQWATSSTYLSTEGFILYDQEYSQSGSLPTVDDPVGRLYNPIYNKLYKANNYACETDPESFSPAPAWLVSANLGTGATYQLEVEDGELVKDSDGRSIRQSQLEAQNIFSWEIHSREASLSDSGTSLFTEDDIADKEYGVVAFTIDLADTADVISANVGTFYWQENSREFDQSQPQAHYSSFNIARADDFTATPLSEQTLPSDNRIVRVIPSSTDATKNFGVMRLDGGSNVSFGHSTQDGNYLSFVLDNDTDGKGILIAQELRSSGDTPVFTTDDIYELSGNTLSISDSANTLANVNGSSLIIDGDGDTCTAELNFEQASVSHDVATNIIGDQDELSSSFSSTSCRIGSNLVTNPSGSELEITFNNVNGKALTLRGFVSYSNEGEQAPPVITLLWAQSDTIGLVFGMKEQALAEGFD